MNLNNLQATYGDPEAQFEDEDDTSLLVERQDDGTTIPVSAFEVSGNERSRLQATLRASADKAAQLDKQLTAKIAETQKILDDLLLQLTTDRRNLAVAQKLARVRKTPQEVLDAQEEAVATLEVETETLQNDLQEAKEQLSRLKATQTKAKLTLSPLSHCGFSLGTTKPLLTVQLLGGNYGLRRNLVYRQNYLETQIDQLQERIARSLELVKYSSGITGFASQHEVDADRRSQLEEELGEVYALQEITGILYDKAFDLLSEREMAAAAYSPRDAITIEQVRQKAYERQAEREEIAAELALRKAAIAKNYR